MTEGARPLTWQGPKLEIAGREYTVRRLGLLDIQRLARIIAKSMEFVNRKAIANIAQMGPEEAGTLLLDVLPYAFDEVIDFVATLIGIDPGKPEEKLGKGQTNAGTIRDPEVFPISALPEVLGVIVEHEDVVAFFGSAKKLASLPALKSWTSRLKEPSMPLKLATAGKTKKS